MKESHKKSKGPKAHEGVRIQGVALFLISDSFILEYSIIVCTISSLEFRTALY